MWIPPGTAVSPPGLSGSSRGLPGELSSPFLSERSLTCSDAFRSFLGRFPTSSMRPGTPDTCASPLGSPQPSRPPSGEYFRLLPFERSRSHSNVFCATLGWFLGSLSPPGTPSTSVSPVVGPVSQLATSFHSPSSPVLGDSSWRCAGLSGGLGGVGGIPGTSPSSVEGH